MLIEFIGAAGVGKSYLSDRVVERLQASGRIALNFDLLEIQKTLPRNLALATKATLMAIETHPIGVSAFMHTATVLTQYSIRRNSCQESEHVYVTSEGLFHRMITMHRQSRSRSMAQLAQILFRHIRPSDLVVVLDADVETVYGRRSARSRAGDEFTIASVGEDLAIVRDSIGLMLRVQRDFHPLMRILRIMVDQNDEEIALRMIMAALEGTASAASATALCEA